MIKYHPKIMGLVRRMQYFSRKLPETKECLVSYNLIWLQSLVGVIKRREELAGVRGRCEWSSSVQWSRFSALFQNEKSPETEAAIAGHSVRNSQIPRAVPYMPIHLNCRKTRSADPDWRWSRYSISPRRDNFVSCWLWFAFKRRNIVTKRRTVCWRVVVPTVKRLSKRIWIIGAEEENWYTG